MGDGEEVKKLTELPVASNPQESSTNPNSPEQLAAASLKEDGELSSSSDDDENYTSTQLDSPDANNPSAAEWSCLVGSTKKSMQHIPTVNGNCTASPVNTVDLSTHASAEANNDKSFGMNRIPSKSSSSVWQAALAGDNNLVIRFSDEDSGSESEDHSQRKDLGSKSRNTGTDSNRRFLPHSSIPKALRHSGANVHSNPRKPNLSRSFVSSANKINIGMKSRAGPAQTSRGRSFNNSNRSQATQGNTFELGLGLNQAKLQDLRQQIAMREKELKRKADQQNKQFALASARENNAKNLSRNAPRKSNMICRDATAKEPVRKRPKLSGSFSNLLKENPQQVNLPTESIQQSNMEMAEFVQQDMVNCCDKSSSKRRADSDVNKSQHKEKNLVSSGNPASTNIDNKHVLAKKACIQKIVDKDHLVKIPPHPDSSKTVMSEKHIFNDQGTSGPRSISPAVENIFQSSLNNANFSEKRSKNLLQIVEMEEAMEKELEEAQEQRYRCEIEERNALKAYRRAQRTLIEANARCTELYRKRELYTSHFGSLIMNDPSLLWSVGEHGHPRMGLSLAEHARKDPHLVPSSSNQKQLSDGQNLRSEPCSEPELSTSDPLHHGFMDTATRRSSPMEDPNISSDDEVFPMEHDANQHGNMQPTSHNSSEQLNDLDRPLDKHFLNDSQDPLILEASLRSKLFARLGRRTLPKTTVSSHLQSADEVGADNDDESERIQRSNISFPVVAADRQQDCNLEGKDHSERITSDPSAQDNGHENTSHSTADSDQTEYTGEGFPLTPDILSTPLVLRSAFEQLKVMSSTASLAVKGIDNQQDYTILKYIGNGNAVESMEVQYSNVTASSMVDSSKDICCMKIGSFSSEAAVDPFWPLCMYELRGKCNNSDCPWQHVADYSGGGGNKNEHDGSHESDCFPGLQNERTTAKPSNRGRILHLPTYLVGLDIIKACARTYESIVAWKDGKCWQKSFSACLALSSLLVKDLPANELFLCGNDGRIEVHGSWSEQQSCFRSRDSLVNYQNEVAPSSMQALEISLLTLCKEVNKVENMKKSLSMLSRAIESDPASEVIWIVYLLVYYSNIKSIEKNDMFSYAVKYNAGSYGLWLMYINSRIHLRDRLAAYNEAITALCQSDLVPEKTEMHSACILDLFLQMLECFCMSGNVDVGVQKLYGLFNLSTYSDEPHSPLLSDILTCLTISDKYMFWVCCVYLVIYRKLPIAVLQKFECEKDLAAFDWSPVDLKDDEKHRAVELVDMMADSVKLVSNKESQESEASKRAAQCFALNHIHCVMALGRLELCCTFLQKYLSMYPQCLELVLIAARSRATDVEGSRFDAFENALTKWPKEVPGVLGLWNQYVEYALERRDPDLAKELLVRWFNSTSELRYRDGKSVDSLASASASNPEFLMPYSNPMDIMFGFLNLSLAKMLQNDHIEARASVDRALRSALPHYFNHCLVEHATFMIDYEQWLTKDSCISEQVRVLKGYLDDARALFVSEPLSRRFIKNADKPRVEQLISNILSPVSSEFLVVNLVLEAWYGPSLVPQKIRHAKELVDLVEGVLEIVPSNYPLAFSVCKLLREGLINAPDGMSESIIFWSSSILVDSIFYAVPVAPECVWVEAAQMLSGRDDLLRERFCKRALSVYPFSKKLWCWYKDVVKDGRGGVEEAARRRGIEVE